jgi:hypothetical protein
MECIVEGPPQAMAVSESMKPLTDIELIQQLDKPVSSSEFRVIQCKSITVHIEYFLFVFPLCIWPLVHPIIVANQRL